MNVLNLVLLGPPGAGKGTQAKSIATEYNIPHISTGDIFRKNIAEETPLGKKAKEYIDQGLLVPDQLTIDIVKDSLLDGFPRTVFQAESLDKMLQEDGKKIDVALLIEVPREDILKRMTGRRVCVSCGASYHVSFNPTKVEGICDVCGKEVIQRKDDKEDTVKERLNVYDNQTQPLISYYKECDKLSEVDGTQAIDKVFEDIKTLLGEAN